MVPMGSDRGPPVTAHDRSHGLACYFVFFVFRGGAREEARRGYTDALRCVRLSSPGALEVLVRLTSDSTPKANIYNFSLLERNSDEL